LLFSPIKIIFQILKELIIESKPIRFNGDGYSDSWVKEAEKRGLSNIKNVPEIESFPSIKNEIIRLQKLLQM